MHYVVTILRAVPIGLSLLLIIVTLLPAVQSNEWWIRVWDYPRVQIALAGVVVFTMMLPMTLNRQRWWMWTLCVSLGIAAVFQTWRILPYTKVSSIEMAAAEYRDEKRCTTILIANVLMENHQTERILDVVTKEEPDTVFIVENNQRWSTALGPIKALYPTIVDHPQSNTYGLLFMTRLHADNTELRFLTDRAIPSIKASLQLPTGESFTFYGLHPKPPRIGQDTDLRDHELTLVAGEIREHDGEAIVGGDLNDVAWSHTTRLFKRISQTLDPRRGRGLYASFHAELPLLRWPLDHVFATSAFAVNRLDVLSHIGSDHFPILAELCLRAEPHR